MIHIYVLQASIGHANRLQSDGMCACVPSGFCKIILVSRAMDAHWVARLGALRRGAWPRGPWERVTPVRQVVAHPKYAARGFRNDIALLRVDPVPLHARTRPACLPPARTLPPAGTHCTVLGWGQLYEHERVFRNYRSN